MHAAFRSPNLVLAKVYSLYDRLIGEPVAWPDLGIDKAKAAGKCIPYMCASCTNHHTVYKVCNIELELRTIM